MTTKEKLQFILKLSGLNQAKLATRLGVTFVALNRWINEKATPRKSALLKIDELYKEYSGEKIIPENVLEAKRVIILTKRKSHKNILKEIIDNPDIRDQFYLSLTYNTNSIEGSTLSKDDTAAVIFHNTALPNKSLVEQLEAKNHQAALEYLMRHLVDKKPLSEKFILKLHGILLNSIRSDAGNYRNHGVRIMGTYVPTANFAKIGALMKKLIKKINQKNSNMIKHIADIHSQFEKIHPFGDGNGRVGRLLMQAMSIKANLAPVIILQEKKRLYYTYLNKAQIEDDLSLLEDFVCDAINSGYEIIERNL